MSATIVQYAICTTAAVCAAAGSCCTGFAASASTAVGTNLVCWNAGTAAATGAVIPLVANTITSSNVDAAGKGYLLTACPAATTGSSTLAVSAAVAATAVYMM